MSTTTESRELAVKAQVDSFRDVVRRVQSGDAAALPALREFLNNPGLIEVLGGDLAKMARTELAKKFVGNDVAFQEALRRKLEIMPDEIAGPNPTPLETLLADRITNCWLHLHYLEILHAKLESMTFEQGNYHQRCLDRAQKRYLAAIKTLAVVRKLALPTVQVNIARRQVNVAGVMGTSKTQASNPSGESRLGSIPRS